MVDFIHNNKALYGVEAICRILPIAPSTYYRTLDLADNPEHRAKRDLHDLHHAEQIKRIWKESSGRYGVRKVWQKLKREGYIIARCTVARLMQKLGIQGVWRGKNKQTTRSRDAIEKSDPLKQLKNHLDTLNHSLNCDGQTELTPFPKRIRDLSKRFSVHYGSSSDNSFSMEYHGMGTRSWASMLTVKAFTELLVSKHEQEMEPLFPIMAAEEPEAHLHPNAQRTLYSN